MIERTTAPGPSARAERPGRYIRARLSRSRFGVLVLAVALTTACGGSAGSSDSEGSPGSSAASAPAASAGSLTVLAAASLQESFTTIADDFEAAHEGAEVTLSFGPSSGLAAQITAGAPADVFAAASTTTMATVVEAKQADAPRVFARNAMEIALPPSNPGDIDALADLASPAVKLAVCQPEVPCGAVAKTVFEKAGLRATPISEEVDVKAVLTKVTLGEVDAGIVYATDVRAAGDKVTGIVIPPEQNATTDYPIAALTDSANPGLAQAFADYVGSEPAQRVLREAGFTAP